MAVTTRRLVILGLAAALGACGFRPMYGQVGDGEVRNELAAVEVQTLTSRLGYLIRDNLLDQLNPAAVEVPARYLLTVQLRRRTSALGIQLDNTITRFNLTLTARFHLLDSETRRVLYTSLVRRVASYNAVRAPYAELAAQLDAERRVAKDVSTDIRTQLAIHFARQDAAA